MNMKKHMKTIKKINQLLLNEQLPEDTELFLLEMKKDVMYGNINYTNGIRNSQLPYFYKDHVQDISKWLNESQDSIHHKIKANSFSEVEHKLIVTSILLKKTKEDDDDG